MCIFMAISDDQSLTRGGMWPQPASFANKISQAIKIINIKIWIELSTQHLNVSIHMNII